MASAINIGGTADRTLIRGAEKIAEKEYVFTKPKVDRGSAMLESTIGSITDGISAIKMKKEQLEVDHEKQLEPFQDIADNMRMRLSEQQEPLPQKVVDAVEKEIKRLQDEFNTANVVGKNDTREKERARTKITAELTRVTNEAVNTRANFIKIGQSAGNWNSSLIDSKNINPLKSILDVENMDKNNNIGVEFIDGKLTFTTSKYDTRQKSVGAEAATHDEYVEKMMAEGRQNEIIMEDEWTDIVTNGNTEYKDGEPVSFTAAQMLGALPQKNLQTDAMILKGNNDFTSQGINDGRHGKPNYFRNTDGTVNQYVYDDEKNGFAGEITKDVFKDIQGRRVAKMGMPSFSMALRDRIDIPMAALDNMFVDEKGERVQYADVFAGMDSTGPDGEPDGILNALDLTFYQGVSQFEKNIDEIINALTNVDHPAFNLDTSADMIADYYTNMKMQSYENRYYAYGGKKTWEELEEKGIEGDDNSYDDIEE